MALRISTGWTTPLKTFAKAPSTRPSRRFSKRCSTLTGSSSGSEVMMVSGRRTPVCKLTGQLVLLFRGAKGQRSAFRTISPDRDHANLGHGAGYIFVPASTWGSGGMADAHG